jgi:voltage-gated potassium channel
VSGRRWGGGGWTTSWVTLLAVLVLYFAVPLDTSPSPLRLVVGLVATLAAVGWVARVVLREAGRQLRGEEAGLRGLHLALLLELALLLFALAYYLLAIHGTQQMAGIETRLDALYFTASTMGTVGYGDIHPVGQLARGVATAHIVFDVVFLALGARLAARALTRPAPGADG